MNEPLLKILGQFPSRKIVVVGDLIADEFLYGQISRVSREAPVLVLEYRDLIRLPGGAANAANNLLDLGCAVTVSGIVGQDDPGRDLTAMLRRKRADIRLPGRPQVCDSGKDTHRQAPIIPLPSR
jgi:bifunctional ADP-heptose synthase (sugar kinase/adenylyltransferase)